MQYETAAAAGAQDARNVWPALPALAEWQDTFETLHLWTQVVGKIRLALSPWLNHSWGSTLYVTPRGLTTSPISCASQTFAITFDFIGHHLHIETSHGGRGSFALLPMSVAAFHRQLFAQLRDFDIAPSIFTRPVELPKVIRFEEDERHAAYDPVAVERMHAAFVQADRVLKRFRARFIGKSSPVHFFWGAFDLAATRFSGRRAPLHPGGAPYCADWVMQEAYSHELASAGFWPGAGLGEAAFYAYAYPEPPGYREGKIEPADAYYSETLREFILPYAAVRDASDPDETLMRFLQSSYELAADLGHWDRAALEGSAPARHRGAC